MSRTKPDLTMEQFREFLNRKKQLFASVFAATCCIFGELKKKPYMMVEQFTKFLKLQRQNLHLHIHTHSHLFLFQRSKKETTRSIKYSFFIILGKWPCLRMDTGKHTFHEILLLCKTEQKDWKFVERAANACHCQNHTDWPHAVG